MKVMKFKCTATQGDANEWHGIAPGFRSHVQSPSELLYEEGALQSVSVPPDGTAGDLEIFHIIWFSKTQQSSGVDIKFCDNM